MNNTDKIYQDFLYNVYDIIVDSHKNNIYSHTNNIQICIQKVVGDNWDDEVDFRVAQYITALHEAIGDLYIYTASNNAVSNVNYLLKARLKKGSCEIIIDISKILEQIIDIIPDKDKHRFLIYLMVMLSGLFFAKNVFKTINRYIKYKFSYELHNEIREEIYTELNKIQQDKRLVNIIISPYRNIAKNFSENDILLLPACKLKKENINYIIAENLLKIRTVYCDDTFYFHWISIGGKRIAIISNDNITLHTKVSVNHDDYNYLSMVDERNTKVQLNINLRHIDNIYIDSMIVGVDKPRSHKKLFPISAFYKMK